MSWISNGKEIWDNLSIQIKSSKATACRLHPSLLYNIISIIIMYNIISSIIMYNIISIIIMYNIISSVIMYKIISSIIINCSIKRCTALSGKSPLYWSSPGVDSVANSIFIHHLDAECVSLCCYALGVVCVCNTITMRYVLCVCVTVLIIVYYCTFVFCCLYVTIKKS